ncbi:NAD(P)-dependent oxidoreductase [Pigmentiphaga aceris]|uniref:NAD(P)-dependent oxidoreductase n=1 Tax=Pigmentiphaga aceris TaxID=1940612 RepID=A0A5C0AX77_9BURK|nr:NAD(P)-dependent oxidoreductase [Pigmentiphaga aceris]QEI07082.1 NAD(P)-dependent oxidoreductase [Pigmentiphaga aceris]
MTKMNIGMIGVGMMGHGIASNIVKHGHSLVVLAHPGNQPLDTLLAAGVKTVDTASALASQVDIVLLCVTGSPQVEAVLLGDTGVLKGIKPGTVIIDCSTAIPTSTERLAGVVSEAGGRFMDAAMTRTPKEAAEGRLNLLVGADEALFAECRPLLECFAENITHAGAVGAGHRMKLLHNFVSLGSVALIAEAAACAERAGISGDVFIEVLSKGGGGGTALERIKPAITDKDTSGLRFAMSNALKDLDYYTTMAEDGHCARAIADGVRQTFNGAVKDSDPQVLVPELVEILAQRGDAN